MIKQGPAGSSMMHIMRHFRLISFFCFFIIVITYFLMYLNYEKVKTITCDEYGRILESNNVGTEIGSPTENGQKVDDIAPYEFALLSNSLKRSDVISIDEANEDVSFDENIGDSIHDTDYERSTWQMKENENENNPEISADEKRVKGISLQKEQHAFEKNQSTVVGEAKTGGRSSDENNKLGGPNKTLSKLALQYNRNIQSIKEGKVLQNKSRDNDVSVDDLSQILEYKIKIASTILRKAKTKPGCVSNETIANSCDGDRCLRMVISDDPKRRISELVTPNKLQLSYNELSTLVNMRNKVSGIYDTILLTAASSNHFLESQALLKNLHEHIFPHLDNFLLIYYNIGLSSDERQQLVKFCNCTVVDFPFNELPEFIGNLKCYAWKPLMIKAHIEQGDVVAWLDSSVRFKSINSFKQIIERTKMRGFQMAGPSEKSPFRTVRSMYHFFGEEPCAYLQMGQLHATSGFFKSDPFVNRAILEPWAACALNKDCMCPAVIQQRVEANKEMSRKWREEGGPVVYGLMHRFDQSAISLIIHKLFYKYYPYVLFDKVRYGVEYLRRDTINYFPTISTEKSTL